VGRYAGGSRYERRVLVDICFYIDPETELPHMYKHECNEDEMGGRIERPCEHRADFEHALKTSGNGG
jgi:hypothetical protein